MNAADPLRIDQTGRTATATDDDHVRAMVEQVLFTSPGERVNRPTFGCGLGRLVFEPNGDSIAAASRLVIQGALQQWLGDVLAVDDVEINVSDSTLSVTVAYTLRRNGQARSLTVARSQ